MRLPPGLLAVFIIFLSSLSCVLCQTDSVSYASCISAKTCRECLIRSPECAWCTDPAYDDDENFPRCDTVSHLMDRGCMDEDIVSPSNNRTTIGDVDLTEIGEEVAEGEELIQVKPQEIRLRMRPGQTEKITLQIRQAEDFPVDLYYLMDLSDSMSDDLAELRKLGDVLASAMKNITSNFRLGYGAFVDKKEVPYVEITPERLMNPCGPSGTCEPPFGFKNVLALTEETEQFSEEVGKVSSSGNLDNPEGGLDALMQATVCTEQIGWRERARHLLLFSTDSPFHIAGDGKLGGIIKPNDGLCHVNEMGDYTESTTLDYPSISQLSARMKQKSILPVFAIGKASASAADPFIYYDKLKDYFHEGYAERLERDSSNIVEVVKDVYESITSGVKVEDDAQPEFFDVAYTAKCVGAEPVEGSSECQGLRLGDDVEFSVALTMKNTTCEGDKRMFTINVGPTAYAEDLVIHVEAICDCECSKTVELSSPECNGNGTLICGGCLCDEGRSGRNCECDREEAEGGVDLMCVKDKEAEDKIECSDRGTCVCGTCVCDTRPNPAENIFGTYCQCDDFSCERSHNQVCGGPTRGRCVCNETTWETHCVCNPNYSGPGCSCDESDDQCIGPDGNVCSGRGQCKCGKCVCDDEKFTGNFCQLCKGCLGKCEEFQPCVRCKGFNTGPYNQTEDEKAENNTCYEMCKPNLYKKVQALNDPVEEGESYCVFKDEADECTIRFTHRQLQNGTYYLLIQEEKECPGTPDILWLILGIILGIIFIGLALLLIWRLFAFIRDRRDFLLFEKERANAQWEAGENPIYRPSTTVHMNPTYKK